MAQAVGAVARDKLHFQYPTAGPDGLQLTPLQSLQAVEEALLNSPEPEPEPLALLFVKLPLSEKKIEAQPPHRQGEQAAQDPAKQGSKDSKDPLEEEKEELDFWKPLLASLKGWKRCPSCLVLLASPKDTWAHRALACRKDLQAVLFFQRGPSVEDFLAQSSSSLAADTFATFAEIFLGVWEELFGLSPAGEEDQERLYGAFFLAKARYHSYALEKEKKGDQGVYDYVRRLQCVTRPISDTCTLHVQVDMTGCALHALEKIKLASLDSRGEERSVELEKGTELDRNYYVGRMRMRREAKFWLQIIDKESLVKNDNVQHVLEGGSLTDNSVRVWLRYGEPRPRKPDGPPQEYWFFDLAHLLDQDPP